MNKLLIRRHSAGQKLDCSLYENQYLTTEALESGNISFNIPAAITTTYITSISYRKNGGDWTTTANSSSAITITVPVASGDVVEWKGIIPRSVTNGGGSPSYAKFVAGEASFNLYGNLMSFFWGDEFIGKTQFPWQVNGTNALGARNLFMETNVVDASNFILPVLEIYFANSGDCHAYAQMFQGCTSLIYPPAVLPATIIGGYVYYQMFMGCTSMTTMPNMESIQDTTASARGSYSSMFNGCTALQYNTQQTIHINRAVYQGCSQMFRDCTSIVNAPNIEVYEFGNPISGNGTAQAFDKMFYGCTSLETPPERIDLTEVDASTFFQMFVNCTNLEYAPIINIRGFHFIDSTLTPNIGNGSFKEMFYGCTNLIDASGINVYFPDDSEWVGAVTFANMFINCTSLIHGPSLNINGTVINKSTATLFSLCQGCNNMETHDIELNYVIDSNATISTGTNSSSSNMFLYCYKMKTSPRIIRLALRDYEFYQAFHSCWQLRDVYVKFNTNTAGNAINSWMNNAGRDVASGITKTIHQAGSLSLPTGTSGCPSGWTLNTADWTAQRHARMTIYMDDFPTWGVSDWYDPDDDRGRDTCIQHFINNLNDCGQIFDYYGDTITISNKTYFIWENREYINYPSDESESVAILLTTTDNFYELTQASLEKGYDAREQNLDKGNYYDLLYGICHSDNTIKYDSDKINTIQTFIVAVKRNQG